MPSKAEGLVLTVDPNLIHKVDTNNAENLFSMWTVFSRCADSVEQGRRLEYFSWRLWNRETFCCDPRQAKPFSAATSLPKDIPGHRIPDVPQLSGSVDSIPDEEAIELSTESDPLDIVRPKILRQDSCASSRSRGRERHITSDHLEKMVVSIVQEKEPNFTPLTQMSIPSTQSTSEGSQLCSTDIEEQATTTATTPATEPACNSSIAKSEPHSDTSMGTPAQTVIRGFSPSQIPSFRVTQQFTPSPKLSPPDAIPEPHSSPAPKVVQSKKPAKFALGGSSGDESSPASVETRQPVPQTKMKMFQTGVSSGEDDSPSLKSAMHSPRPTNALLNVQKQASFSNQVTTQTIQTPSDQSDSYMDESAIDDDDEDSEWEDSNEESGKSSIEDPVVFKRNPSKANLTSQPSLISLMLAGQDDRAKALSNHASHSTPAIPQRSRTMQNMSRMMSSGNDSGDDGLEMKKGLRPTPLKPINEVPRTAAQPIMSNAQPIRHQAALSPRTTRRNMLATELTESLRRHLLWERQQKTSTANAVLKRRHTSHDVANLKQYPEKPYMVKAKDEANSSSWNQYFNRDAFGGYHAQGW